MRTIKAMNLISVHFLILLNITTTCRIIVKEGYLLGSVFQRWVWRDNLSLLVCLIYTATKRVQLSQVKNILTFLSVIKTLISFTFFTSIFSLFSFQTTGCFFNPTD